MSRVVIQGELRPFGLLNVVQFLCNGGLSGALRVYESGLTFTILIERGDILSATSPEQEPIGAKLLRKGKLSEEQLERALQLQEFGKRRGRHIALGRILVHQKMIGDKDLEECVFDQIIETICLSLELPQPYFSFAHDETLGAGAPRASVDSQMALLEAFRVADEVREAEARRRNGNRREKASQPREHGRLQEKEQATPECGQLGAAATASGADAVSRLRGRVPRLRLSLPRA